MHKDLIIMKSDIMEQTLVLLKPDAVERKLMGKIIQRFEDKNFNITNLKMITMSRELAEKHYEEHRGREYFDRIVSFMCSGKVVAMTIEGEGVIKSVRKMVGKTNPLEAEAGTIRGDYGYTTPANLIHASDSEESAKREINLFF